jgi:hypothetical protein
LTEILTTVTLGSANISYAAHAFIVAGGAGAAAGGAGAVEIEVSGTSITDAGVRTAADTEIVVADITTLALNQFADFNKYEDFGNIDFTLTNFECVGLGGAADTSFNIRLLKQDSANWTYSAAAFVPGGTELLNMNTDHSTEQNVASGIPFAYKRAGLSEVVNGNDSEGVVVEITTGANNTVQDMDVHVGVTT